MAGADYIGGQAGDNGRQAYANAVLDLHGFTAVRVDEKRRKKINSTIDPTPKQRENDSGPARARTRAASPPAAVARGSPRAASVLYKCVYAARAGCHEQRERGWERTRSAER